MSNKRLVKMIREGKIPNRGVFIDAYNQSINEDIAMTITTRVNTCNHYYVTDIYDDSLATMVINEDGQDYLLEQQGGGGYSRAYKIESTM